MHLHTFVAECAVDAIAQIRETLGPGAVVLNGRRPPVEGLARLWQKSRREVVPGTNCTRRFPSAGQNVPGHFVPA
jgi:flagellar biosynthesis GTPase FlhF